MGGSPQPSVFPVKVKGKSFQELTKLILVQNVAAHDGMIWAMKFSSCDHYLATGGQDGFLKIWRVLNRARARPSTPETCSSEGLALGSTPVLSSRPVRICRGHEGDILDLSWSSSSPAGGGDRSNDGLDDHDEPDDPSRGYVL